MQYNVATLIALQAERIKNVTKNPNGNTSFNLDDARARILSLCDHLRTGSGIDSYVAIDEKKSGLDRLVLKVPFHHMDPNGYYCGWSNYIVVVKTDFLGLRVKATGKRSDKDVVETMLTRALEYIPTSEEVAALEKAVYAKAE